MNSWTIREGCVQTSLDQPRMWSLKRSEFLANKALDTSWNRGGALQK